MHDIEPFFKWRQYYIASEDPQSPMYEYVNSEVEFTDAIYDHVIHPQWDFFGSPTLFLKILFADYDDRIVMIELLGEWNDVLHDDAMLLKRNVIDTMIESGIERFIFFCDNLLNFHSGDEDYYEEWLDDIGDKGGWIVFLDTFDHVAQEMQLSAGKYVYFGSSFNGIPWRRMMPSGVLKAVEDRILAARGHLM